MFSTFDSLRKGNSSPHGLQPMNSGGALFVQIARDEEGSQARVRIVDQKGKPTDYDYRAHRGSMRALLKAVQQAKESDQERLHWSEHGTLEAEIDLQTHPELLPLLASCDCLRDLKMKPIEGGAAWQQIRLRISQAGEAPSIWKAEYALAPDPKSPALTLETKPLILGDGYLLESGKLRRHQSTGGAASQMSIFHDAVSEPDLDLFLSLFASHYPNIPIELENHTTEIVEATPAQPTILFREVDEGGTLYLELLDSAEGLSEAVMREFEFTIRAQRQGGKLTLSEIDFQISFEARARLSKMLNQLARKKSSDTDYWMAVDDDGTLLLGRSLAERFLATELARLATEFKIVGADHLLRYKIRHAKPKLNLRLKGSGIDFLEAEGDIEIEGERFSILSALSEYRKTGYIAMNDGQRALIDPNYMARLERLLKKQKKGLRVSAFDIPYLEEEIEARLDEAEFPKVRAVFEGFNQIPKRRPQLKHFKGELRPYQKSGLQWLDYLYEHRLGGCLADDMGLGKTIQTIALLSRICQRSKQPTLLIMPRSLIFNWSRELERFAPNLSFSVHHGSGRNWAEATKSQIILSTYGTIRSDIESVQPTPFHCVILDESQSIKNPQSQTTRAILTLDASFRLALSGTPVENNLTELYSLFRFLNPAMFYSYSEFERDFASPIEKSGDNEAAQQLRRKIRPFILRRLKQEVLTELPEKIEQTLYVDMEPQQLEHYETRRRFYQKVIREEMETSGLARSRFTILEAMLELRQIATIPEAKTDGTIPSSKISRLIEALEEATANGHKCLVFTNFLTGVELIGNALEERQIGHLSMTGASNDRQKLVEQFQNDPAVSVFVMTLKTGGVGLNLTAADHVFILDPWWNQAAESQAVDRAHRMGQRNAVFTYRLIARLSIEEKIARLQERKRALVDQIVTTDSDSFKQLDEADIDALFSD